MRVGWWMGWWVGGWVGGLCECIFVSVFVLSAFFIAVFSGCHANTGVCLGFLVYTVQISFNLFFVNFTKTKYDTVTTWYVYVCFFRQLSLRCE